MTRNGPELKPQAVSQRAVYHEPLIQGIVLSLECFGLQGVVFQGVAVSYSPLISHLQNEVPCLRDYHPVQSVFPFIQETQFSN